MESGDAYDIMNVDDSYDEEPGEEGLYPATMAGAAGAGSPLASMLGSPGSVMSAATGAEASDLKVRAKKAWNH